MLKIKLPLLVFSNDSIVEIGVDFPLLIYSMKNFRKNHLLAVNLGAKLKHILFFNKKDFFFGSFSLREK